MTDETKAQEEVRQALDAAAAADHRTEERNKKSLSAWYKKWIWGAPSQLPQLEQFGVRAEDEVRLLRGLVTYMTRRLSLGAIPNVQVVEDVLEGRSRVAPCGYINCFMEEGNHTH